MHADVAYQKGDIRANNAAWKGTGIDIVTDGQQILVSMVHFM